MRATGANVLGVLGLLLAACAPAAAPAPAQPTAASAAQPPAAAAKPPAQPTAAAAGSDAEWARVLAAAKQEGHVSIITHPSTQWSGWVKVFEAAFPDIKVEHLGMRPSDVTPRILSEQKNGQFLYDLMVAPTSNSVQSLSPAGAFQDIRPFISTDRVNPAQWPGGLELFADKSDPFNLVTSMTMTHATLVNRKLAPVSELSSIDDLVKPQFKDKIAIYDPTAPNNGSFAVAYFIKERGEPFARQVLENAVFVESSPDVTNFVASGRYLVGLGSDPQAYGKLKSEGRAADLEMTRLTAFAAASGIAVMKNAPHPNATKVVVDWFLSQEGQEAYAREGATNSRRAGVKSYLNTELGYTEPDWNNLDKVLRPNEWQGIDLVAQATALAKEMRR